MDRTNEMVEVLEDFIIHKVKQMKDSFTSPEEITALSELVKALNQTPRTLEAFELKEFVAVSTTATND